VYLDNAATSFPKPESVYEAMDRYGRTVAGSPGRAEHRGAAEATPAARRARELQAEVLRALGHPVRLEILELLRGGELCVCEMEPALGLRQPNISQHLAALRSADLVATRRGSVRVMYRIVDPAVFQVVDLVTGIARRQSADTSDTLTQARTFGDRA